MSELKYALEPVLEWEGEYSNDPDDMGGETYRGISKRNFPNWKGWGIIQAIKKANPGHTVAALNALLRKNEQLQSYVLVFYKMAFWDVLKLEAFPQALANEIFEQAVHMGPKQAILNLQKFCNVANYDPASGYCFETDLTEDGKNGPKTKKLVQTILKKRFDEKTFIHALQCIQGAFYINLAYKNRSQRKFLKGWLTRTV